MSSLAGSQASTTASTAVAAWRNPVGGLGGEVSGQAAVDAIVSERDERFPARSKATTASATLSPQSRRSTVYCVLETVLRFPLA